VSVYGVPTVAVGRVSGVVIVRAELEPATTIDNGFEALCVPAVMVNVMG
jgi:hypothetical protein